MPGSASGNSHFGDERKFVTVLFADIVNSSRLVANQDPEEADEFLLPIIHELTDCVQKFGGTVNQILGDGIMAAFGVPDAQEDHALRACLAAQEMISAVAGIDEQSNDDRISPASIRVGLNSGEVVVQLIGEHPWQQYRLIGETVYAAARAEQNCSANTVLMTGRTLELVANHIHAKPTDRYIRFPKSEPIVTYELTGIESHAVGSLKRDAFHERGFVGRSNELGSLFQLLPVEEQMGGNVAIVTGEPGIGKSRLVKRFFDGLDTEHYHLIVARHLPHGLSKPMDNVFRSLRKILGCTVADDIGKRPGAELVNRLTTPYAKSVVSQICGRDAEDNNWRTLEPAEKQRAIIETICELLVEASHAKPLVIFFDDIHWADSESRSLAQMLASRIRSSRILFILTCRTSFEGIWADWTNVSEYRLKPLSYDESLELVSALLGKDRNLDDLKGSIVQRAQGNPFFLTECSRSIRDADGDSGTRSTHMARFGTPAQIPASIHGLLAERIDRLSPKQKAIVQGAAIVGQKFDIDLLKMIVGSSARSLVVDLGSLEKAGFVERTRIIPRLEFSFRHALIYDVAYGSVLRKRRTEMHGRLLRQIEKRSRQAFPNKPELLAYHACRSRNLPETYLYCRKAGQRAQEKSRNREAAGYFENSLAALGKLPKTARNAARSFDTGLDFVQTLFPLSNYAAAWKNLSVCRELSHTLEDRRRAAKLSSAETLYHWITGDVEQSVRSGWEAHQLSVKLKDQELQIVGAGRLGAILLERGDYLDARRLLTETISRIPPEENHKRFGLLVSAPVSCRASLSRCLGELGLFEEALAEGDDAIRIADELDHRFSQLYANLFVGNVLMRRGEFDRSMPLLERAFEICQSTRSDLLYPFVAGSIGYAHSKTGKLLKGKAMIAEAVEAACRQEVRTRLPLMMMWLAETQFESGDAGQAKFSASKATSVAQEIGEKGHQAWSLWMRGDLLSRSGDGESYEVSGYLRQAVSIAQRRQMKPLLAMCQYTQNRLAQRTGAWVNFGAGTGRSDAELRALGMRHWLDSRTPVYEPATREYQFLPVENQHRDR